MVDAVAQQLKQQMQTGGSSARCIRLDQIIWTICSARLALAATESPLHARPFLGQVQYVFRLDNPRFYRG